MLKKIIKNSTIYILNLILPKIKIFPEQLKTIYSIKFNNVKIFFIPTSDITYRRWKVFEKNGKERNTIEWIETFDENSVFYDIGANIGVFSIYAALKKNLEVYSFEPEPNSFVELFNAVKVNKANVTPMLIPLDKKTNCNFFNMDKFVAGLSGHRFGKRDKNKLNYGISSDSIDNLILNNKIPRANYIKIDVDGLEDKVIRGLDNLIKEDILKSILIEFTNEEQMLFYKMYLKKYNFYVSKGPSDNNKNYIFSR